MTRPVHIDVVSRLKQAAEAKTAADPALVRALLAGGAGAFLGGGAMSALSHAHEQAELERARSRNTTFGAGMAAGMAGPQIVDALHGAMHNMQGPAQ